MLEKRVKSRFSHRIIRVSPPATLDSYMNFVQSTMTVSSVVEAPRLQATPTKEGRQSSDSAQHETWQARWKDAIEVRISSQSFGAQHSDRSSHSECFLIGSLSKYSKTHSSYPGISDCCCVYWQVLPWYFRLHVDHQCLS